MSKKITNFLISGLIIGVSAWVVAAFIGTYITHGGDVTFDPAQLFSGTTIAITFLAIIAVGLYYLSSTSRNRFEEGSAKSENIGGVSKYYDTHWLSVAELKRNPDYKYHLYTDLKNSTNIGIPIRAEYLNGKLHINMYQSIHTLIIGTTGSGKTTQFVDPMIQILGESKAKPGMVITDPKGELYDNHSVKLREAGYRIITFDLRDPYKSSRWNPLTRAFDLNQRALNLEKEVLIHRGDTPDQYPKLIKSNGEFGAEWYELENYAFHSVEELKIFMKGLRQQLKTDALEDLSDIAEILSPVESSSDPTWERGAKEFLQACLLAMLEDSEKPELGMTRDRYNFYNLSKLVNMRDNDRDAYKSLSEYFQGRDKFSVATQLSNQVLTNAPSTKSSYMGIVTERVRMFNDPGVAFATSINEMELSTFADQPTALFIKIPDERVARHGIASMFISQLYKTLVAAADKNGGKLKREVHFILDEFANMPPIVNFNTIITVARGRRIFFTLILQSYVQLSIKYKEDVANTVKDNCNIHVYIASNDQSTKEEFSKRCGNITVQTKQTSVSKGLKEESGNKSYSIQVDSRPLIYPEELGALKNEMIVSILKRPPIKAKFIPSYYKEARKFYKIVQAPPVYVTPKILDEQYLYYDFKERNNKVLHGGDDDFDDFDILG